MAAESPEHPHFLIIDEINRGNLAKILGELYFLLEYRTKSVELMYSQDHFSLPENLYIIGTMNTADRSIALIDGAMRRRFAFFGLFPDQEPTKDLLERWCQRHNLDQEVVKIWRELNRRIGDSNRMIGPSYFMRPSVHLDGLDQGLSELWVTDILPHLQEQFFSERDQVHSRFGLDAIRQAIAVQPGR